MIFAREARAPLKLSGANLSLVPRPFVGETAWQLTRVQTVYGYDVKEITAPPVQAVNIG